MTKEVSIIIPARSGSTRVLSKNVRKFGTYNGGLLELKLEQLREAIWPGDEYLIREIIVSTNDPVAIEVAETAKRKDYRIKVDRRPDNLCLNETVPADLITYFARVCTAPVMMQALCTSPFVNHNDYLKIIDAYFTNYCDDPKNSYDSLATVKIIKNFVLNNEGVVVNNIQGTERWPRTQDLPPLYEFNHAVYMHTKKGILQSRDRIGFKPLLYQMDWVKSIDIDWNIDFKSAEILMGHDLTDDLHD